MANANDDIKTVRTRQGNFQVKGLGWKSYLRAVREITSSLIDLMGEKNLKSLGGGSEEIALEINKEKIIEALQRQEATLEWILVESTGKKQEEIAEFSGATALCLLDAIIELNWSEEVVGLGKKLAAKVTKLLGIPDKPKTESLDSSISSSTMDTPLETSSE